MLTRVVRLRRLDRRAEDAEELGQFPEIRDAMLDGSIPLDDGDAARAWLRAHPELLSSD